MQRPRHTGHTVHTRTPCKVQESFQAVTCGSPHSLKPQPTFLQILTEDYTSIDDVRTLEADQMMLKVRKLVIFKQR